MNRSRQQKAKVLTLFKWGGGVALCCMVVKWFFFPGVPFEASRWRFDEQGHLSVRLAMGDRLVGSGALIGKTRSEVCAMLGEPMEHPEFADWDLVYWLGPERCWPVLGSEYLLVRLSRDGRVRECRIMSDG